MRATDSHPELVVSAPLMLANDFDPDVPPRLILADDVHEPEPTSLRLFWLQIEAQPELYLYAVGKAIGPNPGTKEPQIGELEKVRRSLDEFLSSGWFNLIVDVDTGTRVSLESDGDYQLIADKYHRSREAYGQEAPGLARQIRLRMLRTFIIRSTVMKYALLEAESFDGVDSGDVAS